MDALNLTCSHGSPTCYGTVTNSWWNADTMSPTSHPTSRNKHRFWIIPPATTSSVTGRHMNLGETGEGGYTWPHVTLEEIGSAVNWCLPPSTKELWGRLFCEEFKGWYPPFQKLWALVFHYLLPIGSMYGIFTYIYHKHQPNVGKYTIHDMDPMGYIL